VLDSVHSAGLAQAMDCSAVEADTRERMVARAEQAGVRLAEV